MKRFTQPLRIRMAHCDTAGIVYHPQYFVMLNALMEDFFREVVGVSYEDAIAKGWGFPVVGVRSDFTRPSRLGDACTMELWLEHVGTTSARFAMRIVGEKGDVRLAATETVVCVKKVEEGTGLASMALPDDVRAVFLEYLADDQLTLRA